MISPNNFDAPGSDFQSWGLRTSLGIARNETPVSQRLPEDDAKALVARHQGCRQGVESVQSIQCFTSRTLEAYEVEFMLICWIKNEQLKNIQLLPRWLPVFRIHGLLGAP